MEEHKIPDNKVYELRVSRVMREVEIEPGMRGTNPEIPEAERGDGVFLHLAVDKFGDLKFEPVDPDYDEAPAIPEGVLTRGTYTQVEVQARKLNAIQDKWGLRSWNYFPHEVPLVASNN